MWLVFQKGVRFKSRERREDILYPNVRCTASLSRLAQNTNLRFFLQGKELIKKKSKLKASVQKSKASVNNLGVITTIFFAYCQIKQKNETHLAFGGNTASIALM